MCTPAPNASARRRARRSAKRWTTTWGPSSSMRRDPGETAVAEEDGVRLEVPGQLFSEAWVSRSPRWRQTSARPEA
eukprot:12023311-Alexandrium_andersonii.AAC.1